MTPANTVATSLVAGELDVTALRDATVCETHGSRVYLSGDRAYKVRKAVKFPFLDQSTPELRRTLALRELTLNRELAPGTYLGVRTLAGSGGSDVAVVMRRFREDDTLAARLAQHRVDPDHSAALGAKIAAFHARVEPEPVQGASARVIARLHGAADGWAAHTVSAQSAHRVWSTIFSLERRFLTRAAEIDDRAGSGFWREGHGDLRADHVVFDEHGLSIVDRLEFDRALRVNDIGDDLAFLLMDLRSRGGAETANRVLEAYRATGGDPGDDALVALWCGYRAIVSLEVATLRQAQSGAPDARGRLAALAELAAQCVWEARDLPVIVVCGPPATGKSTLAAELARRSGWTVVSSDVVRKASLGLRPEERAPQEGYARGRTEQVYEALGNGAREALARGARVIVDATMGDASMRRAFIAALGSNVAVTFVECEVPSGVAERRAERRADDPCSQSDADGAVVHRLRAAFQPLDEVAPTRHLVCRADRPVEGLADEVEARLDLISTSG